VGVAAETRSARRGAAGGRRFLGFLRDPMQCFVAVALVAGGALIWIVPPFAGIDEPAHFFRSYQLTTGKLLPEESPNGGKFHGACVPDDLIHQVDRHVAHALRNVGVPAEPGSLGRLARCKGHPGEHFYTYSTFGSPLPYIPQAVTIGISRAFDPSASTMDTIGRITVLLSYVLLVAVAIRRSPRQKWAFAAVGLLPLALFQSATVTHDGLTIAIALLVVSSALRIADPPVPVPLRSVLLEAGALSIVLALCKPTYIVLALLYLLPLVGPARRREMRPLAAVVGGAVVLSILWNAAVENLWRTDADLLGIKIDPDVQRHRLLTRPWEFVEQAFRSVVHQIDDWLRAFVNVGDRVVDLWPLLVVIALVLAILAVSLQADRDEPPAFHWQQRALVAVTFLLGIALVFGANYIIYTGPNDDEISGLAARYFVPLLVLVPLAIGVLPWAWARARDALVPIAVGYVPFYAVFVVAVAERMR
jgi:hypothetical protein